MLKIKNYFIFSLALLISLTTLLNADPIENFDSYADYNAFLSAGYDDTPFGGNYDIKAITNTGYSGKCLFYQYDLPSAWNYVQFTYWGLSYWSNYKSISFWIKGSNVAKVSFLFKENDDNDEWLYEYTTITTNWQKVIIPLKQGSWIYVDWDGDGGANNMTHKSIDHWRVYWQTSSGNVIDAKVWIDEIEGNTNEIRDDWSFDSYNDYADFIAAGYSDTPSDWREPYGNTYYNLKEITTNGAYSGKCIHYNYNIGNAWESIGFVNNNPTNWSWADYFQIYVKGYAGDPETLDIYFKEADGDEWVYQKSGLNANWQQILVPLVPGSWSYTDWDQDGGPQTFGLDNIVKFFVGLESSTGNRLNKDVWFDEMKLVKINNPPKIVDFSPKYNVSSNNPQIILKVKDPEGINAGSIKLFVNNNQVSHSLNTVNGTNIISYNASGLPSESRVKVELTVADQTSLTQYFSFSFWVGSQEKTYDTFEYDGMHFANYWGTPSYNGSGTATTVTNSPYEGRRCVKVKYSLSPSYGEFGISRTFDTVQDWSGFSNLIIYTKASNIQANTFLDVLIYEEDGDVWFHQRATAFDQTSWEKQTVFIGNNFGSLNFAGWCTNQPGYSGDKLPDPDRVKKVVFNVSGQGLTNTVYFDNFYIHGWAPPVDNQAPTFVNLYPANNATNINKNTNIHFSIKDNVKVVSNSINVTLSYINYSSNTNYTINTTNAVVNGAFKKGFNGSIVANGNNGYDVIVKPSEKFPTGTKILLKIRARDTSNNWSTNNSEFITAGVAYGYNYPLNGQINVATNSDIIIYMDRVNDGTINVIILSSTNWSYTNWATQNGSAVPPFDDSNCGAFGAQYPWRWQLGCPPFAFGSTNRVIVWASDYSGNWTTNQFQFVVISDKPQIQNTKPSNNQVNFSVTNSFYFETVDNMQIKSNTINVKLNTNYIITNGAGLSGYNVSFTLNSFGGYNVTIKPQTSLSYNTAYTLTIWCSDNENNWVTNIIVFRTESAPDTTKPVVSVNPQGGTYFGKITITLSANEPATIYYTLDGTEPTTNSLKFINSGSIEITSDTILKYFAKDLANNVSDIKTEIYRIVSTTKKAVAIPTVADLSKGKKCKIIIGESGYAQVKIYNVRGDLVKEYTRKYYNKGEFEEFPENFDLGAGLYIVYIKGDNFEEKLKIILVK